ncbi:DUF3006 domain-containing protein [Bacillus cereus group sp. TH152-1LC]|uniref:DUF3006 domain-containing protein n=1 Tax=Bacillus cereus group sp. TH152-1LC TaxID=3018060 RepID=UPI0022E0B5C2|nr:DUF3006 domain-containing protein [Bacillus cereus group sp. TH152-1LC]MDA1674712.1 DUF3006 domain-containing protein [Bacillus cereus group sp. TH152-1LC]
MKGIIDRFEGNKVVVEIDGKTKDFDKNMFPRITRVGDVVEISNGKVSIHKKETEKLRKEIEDLMDELFE